MRILLIFLTIISLSTYASHAARADDDKKQYITDEHEVTMRSGTSTKHQILRLLSTGTALTLLKVDKDSGYSKVRTADGVEGWVITRFLVNTPVARDRLLIAEQTIANLRAENKQLKQEKRALTTENAKFTQEINSLTTKNNKLSEQLSYIRNASSNVIAIDEENKKLKASTVTMERDLRALEEEYDAIKDRTARDWFMVGAFVIILGIVIGLVIPKIRWRKRSSWDSL